MAQFQESINYYEVLEIKPEAHQHEITTAYERARQTYSNDNPAIYTIFSDQEAKELLSMVEEAYSVLGNKTLRTLYDERLFSGKFQKSEMNFQTLSQASKQNFPEKKVQPAKIEYKQDSVLEAKYKSANDWNGSLLKEVRDYKAFPIERLSEITKITPYYIKAVEDMDASNLPATVFVRGYVVQIAKTLGLNEKVVADSYMKNFRIKHENLAKK